MRLIVIGAGPAYTDRRGAASASYLIRADGAGGAGGAAGGNGSGAVAADTSVGGDILLDLGQGAFPNLASTIEPSTLTAVFVSHLHPDHFVDLVPLRHYLKWQFDPARRVGVFGPAGLADRIDSVNGQPGFASASLEVASLMEGVRTIGRFDVEARRVRHTDESYAFRVSAAGSAAGSGGAARKGLVYSGDCGRADDLIPLIRPGDTLLCEASFGADTVPPGAEHLTSAEAGRVAATGGASSLLLTHILMGHDRADALAAAQSAFAGPVRMVTEGESFEV
jgi:ribonuclease BN (tRNA processing enzyme)